MEILSKGIDPKNTPYEGTCYVCKTRVRFIEAEGHATYNYQDGWIIKVTCPVCGASINGEKVYL